MATDSFPFSGQENKKKAVFSSTAGGSAFRREETLLQIRADDADGDGVHGFRTEIVTGIPDIRTGFVIDAEELYYLILQDGQQLFRRFLFGTENAVLQGLGSGGLQGAGTDIQGHGAAGKLGRTGCQGCRAFGKGFRAGCGRVHTAGVGLQAGDKGVHLIQLGLQGGELIRGGLQGGGDLRDKAVQHFRVVVFGQRGQGYAQGVETGGCKLIIGGSENAVKELGCAGVQGFAVLRQGGETGVQGGGAFLQLGRAGVDGSGAVGQGFGA